MSDLVTDALPAPPGHGFHRREPGVTIREESARWKARSPCTGSVVSSPAILAVVS